MVVKAFRVIGVFFLVLVLVFFLFWIFRFILPSEIDDVSPEIVCQSRIMEKSDILWVIPKFNGYAISKNEEWCKYILSLNKTIGMHGVVHTYREFNSNITQEYLDEGIQIFEDCFGFKPDKFKPPQLEITEENRNLVEENGLKVVAKFNQVTRKVYHCDDRPEFFSNEMIEII